MSDIKFSCPDCDQHILCDSAWAGLEITCPTCQHSIVVTIPTGHDAPAAEAPPPEAPAAPTKSRVHVPGQLRRRPEIETTHKADVPGKLTAA